MKKSLVLSVLAASALSFIVPLAVVPASAAAMMSSSMESNGTMGIKMVGGAPMYPAKNIIQNAVNSKDHTTLVAAVKAAGLVSTLEGKGPFTVFAPTNEAFAALPKGTVATLLKPENKAKLATILEDHVIAGHYDTSDLMTLAKKKGGAVKIKTVGGAWLTFTDKNGHLYVTDANGGTARITIANVEQSNGVIQVVNKVLLPKM